MALCSMCYLFLVLALNYNQFQKLRSTYSYTGPPFLCTLALASINISQSHGWLCEAATCIYNVLYMCTILHNLGVITVGAAESWDIASGGAGMLLQSQWGSSGAEQEHLEWNKNKKHPLPTGTENHKMYLSWPPSSTLDCDIYAHIDVVRASCVPRYQVPPQTLLTNSVYCYIYLPAILAPGRSSVTLILEGFPPTRITPGVAVMISWRGLPFALTGRGPHVSW